MMMTTWRHDGAAQIPGPWIQVDLGTSLAYLSFPQSKHDFDHDHDHDDDDDDDDDDKYGDRNFPYLFKLPSI